MIPYKRSIALVAAASLFLSACVTSSSSGGRSSSIGPKLSSLFGKEVEATTNPSRPKIDIVIPVFDPGIEPEKVDEYEALRHNNFRDGQSQDVVTADEYVWPELRRAEAIRFAYKLKVALDKTGEFGAVRVTPDATATADLYLLGRINESDGEDVEFEIEAIDITGNRWLKKTFGHAVEKDFHTNIRNKGKDAYDPAFAEAAEYVVEELKYYETAELDNIRKVTDLRFASQFTEDAFKDHLIVESGKFQLISSPSDKDPMLMRTRSIRIRDQLFVDGLQQNYEDFSYQMETSYLIWQEQSMLELQAKREAQLEAIGQGILGVLAIALAVAAIAAGANSIDASSSAASTTVGIAAGTVGAMLLSESFQTSKEAGIHREALEELGQSIDLDLAPQVVKFEEESLELQGTASEQFAQWREFLQKIYAEEKTPNVQF